MLTNACTFFPDMASTALVFTAEEIARFRIRLEEGYDLPDPRYWQWVHSMKAAVGGGAETGIPVESSENTSC